MSSGPTMSIGLDPDILLSIGDLEKAAKAAENVIKQTEKEALKLQKQGKEVDAELLQREAKAAAVLKKITDIKQAQERNDVLNGKIEPGVQRIRAAKGSIVKEELGKGEEQARHILQQRTLAAVGRGHERQLQALFNNGVGAFATAFGAAAVAQFVADTLIESAESRERAEKLDLETASGSFQFARNRRRDLSDIASSDINRRRNAIANDSGNEGGNFLREYFFGQEREAKRRKARADQFDFIEHNSSREVGSVISRQELEAGSNFQNAMNANEVNRRFGWKEAGLFGALKSQTWDRFWGIRDEEREKYAMELTEARKKALERRLEEEERREAEDPTIRTQKRNIEAQRRAYEREAQFRLNDWSKV